MNIYEKFMALALKEAKKAFDKNETPIGAVIVKDGKVIARAHNLRETKKNAIEHAEIAVINKACGKLGRWRLEDCDLYVTLEPCLMCSGAIVQSKIKNLYFGAYDKKGGAIWSIAQIPYIKGLNHQVECRGGIMEEECSEIIKKFFRRLRETKQKND